MIEFDLPNEAATAILAARLAQVVDAGDVIALKGELGAGKTSFARAFIRARGGGGDVPSPTFTLVQQYETNGVAIWHFDLYRLDSPDEAWELGIEEAFEEAVSLIEWPERLGSLLPERCLEIFFKPGDGPDARRVTLSSGPRWRARLEPVVALRSPDDDRSAAQRRRGAADFLAAAGWGGTTPVMLAGDASFRKYYRLDAGGRRAVLMDAPPPEEDVRPFVAVAGLLRRLGLSAPEILAEDADSGFLLIEDFGDATYTRLLALGEDEVGLYGLAVDTLVALHRAVERHDLPDLPAYDEHRLLAEAALLVDWYVPAVTGAATPHSARETYVAAWKHVLSRIAVSRPTLVLRDYHVDNLMLLHNRSGVQRCGLLDFQDAVVGPRGYDLVSLLEDARRDVVPTLRRAMSERYLAAFPDLDRADFDREAAILAVQRNCKIIGIFTRLCRRDGKPAYLDHIPRLWGLIAADVVHPALAPIAEWLDRYLPPALRQVPRSGSPA